MEHDPHQDPTSPCRPRMLFATRVVGFLLILIALQYTVPRIIEEIEYALVRGRQRAEHETAAETLEQLNLGSLSQASQWVSQRVAPSVVHILAQRTNAWTGESQDSGSGVIVDSEGYILTNFHVVRGAEKLRVVLSDGRRVEGRVQGSDPLTDLAVVKIDGDRLVAAEWGDSDTVREGALVWAVGSPYGLERSITFGILSARDRGDVAGSVFQEFLQTDAAVNPGNSGGPLVDMSGRVIGINSMIVGESYQGIGFAVPSKIARQIYSQLRHGKTIARGWLGVRMSDLAVVERPDSSGNSAPSLGGVRVVSVVEDAEGQTPADQAGMLADDVIVRWAKQPIRDSRTLSRIVAGTQIGSQVEVEVIRAGEPIQLVVTVGRRP